MLWPFCCAFNLNSISCAADFWWIRMFDYPHIQLTILTFVAIVVYFIEFNIKWTQDYLFAAVLMMWPGLQALLLFKDIRKGRDFYNSFNTTSFIMKWPLDHFFVS
jgi:hypothetical protein